MPTGSGDVPSPALSAASASAASASAALDPDVRRAVRAVYVVFIGAGFGLASWASRIPQIRDQLHVTPGTLGLILLCGALGSLVALPISSILIMRLGESRAVTVFSTLFAVGTATIGLGVLAGIPWVASGLLLVGFGNGTWDVAMNVQGAAVEQALGRVIMSRFHAGFSIGTVLGAGIGAGMVALHVPVTAHLLGVAVILVAAVPQATRGFLPHPAPAEHAGRSSTSRALEAWREPRTLLIGLFVFCLAFTEGNGNDWLNVGVIDGYHASAATGTVTFALFLAAMTGGRWFGPSVIERCGRVVALRASAVTAIVGLLLVVFGHVLALAMLGAVLWGLGSALGFPTGISAASDDPAHAAARVSVATSIGYVAFLAGPPLVGLVADHVGVLRGLTVTLGVLAVALLVSGAMAPLQPGTPDDDACPGHESARVAGDGQSRNTVDRLRRH